jgi:two-component system CheB/CheR fusion protein
MTEADPVTAPKDPGKAPGTFVDAPIGDILESVSDAFYAVDRDWRFTYLNRKAEEWWGRRREELLGKVYWEEFPVAVGSEPYQAHLRAAETREVVRLEAMSPILGKWVDISIYPTGDGGLSVYFRDISEKRNAEALLRESEERYRLIVENARDHAIFTLDPEGRVDQWYQGAALIFGWSAEEIAGRTADVTYTAADLSQGVPQWERDTASQEGWAPNVRWHVRKDGSAVFIDGIATALRNDAGELTGFLKIGQDVTARRRAEEHQRVLLAELQHRVRNTLGVIRSIARRTAATSESVEEMSMHLEGRIGAFSRVQAVVTRSPDAGADLSAMIEDELLAHAAREGEALKIEGPEVCLKPRVAETMSLAIHELATNAVKYGALSADGGRISVTWQRSVGAGGDTLTLVWEENGVRGVPSEPQRQGFGLELLQRTLPYELGAETEVDFRPEGLCFTMRMPLGPNVLAE